LRGINKANREHAHRLLQCLTVANWPLRVEELVEVLAVEFDADLDSALPKLNPDWRWADQPQAILSTCSSLIAIVDDGYSQVVQFSHFSVKEFLTSDRLAQSSEDVSLYHVRLGPAHTILAQACLRVLLSLHGRITKDHSRDSPLSRFFFFFFFYIPLTSARDQALPSLCVNPPWNTEAPYGGREGKVGPGCIAPMWDLLFRGYLQFVLLFAGNVNFQSCVLSRVTYVGLITFCCCMVCLHYLAACVVVI
jgi:hypothetical protein